MEVARRFHPAFNHTFTQGGDELFELLDPDVEWIPITSVLDGTRYRGEDEVRGWIDDIKREWEIFEIWPWEFRDLGDERVLILGTWRARGRSSGVELDSQPATWLVRSERGKITRMQTFTDRAKAFEAAGIAE
jgi:ketosteroid isomerase-like protein